MWRAGAQIDLGKMFSLKLSSLLILLSIVHTISSLTLTAIEVPKYAKVGERLRLVCNFSLGTDQLYSVKWYKDNMEFYRFTPRDQPRAQQFWVSGMVVDLETSDDKTVQLKAVSLETAGRIMCEVSTEAPRFKTAEASGELTVVQPPSSGPVISPLPRPGERFSPGDLLEINCTAPPSNPQAKLRYFINDQMDDGSHTVQYRHRGRDGLTSPTLSLSTRIRRRHLQAGVLRVKCQAVIYSVWNQSTMAVFPGPEVGEKALERILRGGSPHIRLELSLVLVGTLAVFTINEMR